MFSSNCTFSSDSTALVAHLDGYRDLKHDPDPGYQVCQEQHHLLELSLHDPSA